jgi:hypothetical protein
MAGDGYIAQVERPHASLDYQWASRIKGKPLPKSLRLSGYEHAVAVADVYVAWKLTGLLRSFRSNPLKHRALEEDIRMTVSLGPAPLYWEVERSPRGKGVIAGKAARYMKLPGPLHVIFTAVSGGHAEDILDELPRDRGALFIVTLHEYVSADPLMQGYVSADRPSEFQSLQDILSSVRTGGTSPDNGGPVSPN